jgi:16S rRNA (guanine966-N2)-methyltransferase
MLRIIAGEWRGRKLAVPQGDATRPTADRTRETLFSMLISRLGSFEGLTVGDLFAGSGALGFEALSRGAASAVFVEQDAAAIRAIRSNISALHAQPRCDVRASSVLTLAPAKVPLDILFLDPPYGTGAGVVAIERLIRHGWIGEATWISLETAAGEIPVTKSCTVDASRKVGKALITLMKMA